MFKNTLGKDYEDVKPLLEKFVETRDEDPENRRYVSYYGMIDNQLTLSECITGPCFSSMAYPEEFGLEASDVKYVISSYQDFPEEGDDCYYPINYTVNKDVGHRYINWLVNSSPWADIFLYADEDLFLYKPDVPSNLLLGAMIATRLASEVVGGMDYAPVIWWDKMVNNGVCPRVAYVLCHCLQISGDKLHFSASVSHTAIYPNSSDPNLLPNFIHGNTVKVKSSWIVDPEYYNYNSDILWVDRAFSDERRDTNLISWLCSIPIASTEAVTLNIFDKRQRGNKQFTYEELLKTIPEIERRMKEL